MLATVFPCDTVSVCTIYILVLVCYTGGSFTTLTFCISQRSVVTCTLTCSYKYDKDLFARLLLSRTVKELWSTFAKVLPRTRELRVLTR